MSAKQLVALRCSECDRAVAAVLPECADLWCLCDDCAPSGAMRRKPEAQDTALHDKDENSRLAHLPPAERETVKRAAWEAWAGAKYRLRLTDAEAERVYDETLAREIARGGAVSRQIADLSARLIE